MVMRKGRNHSDRKLVAVSVAIGLLAGLFVSYYYFAGSYQATESPQISLTIKEPVYSRAQINLVAVDQNGMGISTPLVVEAKPGNGETLANIDKLLFWTDTQQSVQTAKSVAENVTGISASNYDITYSIESNATVVGGPSAGVALTIATIAALKNETIRGDVIITGTINSDGTIGEIGGVLEKATAAKEAGAMLLLVPKGQSMQTYLRPNETCVTKGNSKFCETTYKEETISIGKDAGISVLEVGNVSEAYKYFRL
jgi:uncharacterized protein